MNSARSYLVNALIDWVVDNGCTPHMVIDVSCEGVVAPLQYAVENRLVLNVSGKAVRNFKLDPDGLEFDARFNGESQHVSCPAGAIVGVFARENGEGTMFRPEKQQDQDRSSDVELNSENALSQPPSHLSFVKNSEEI